MIYSRFLVWNVALSRNDGTLVAFCTLNVCKFYAITYVLASFVSISIQFTYIMTSLQYLSSKKIKAYSINLCMHAFQRYSLTRDEKQTEAASKDHNFTSCRKIIYPLYLIKEYNNRWYAWKQCETKVVVRYLTR